MSYCIVPLETPVAAKKDAESLASKDKITSSDYDKSKLGILVCFGVSALAAVMAVMTVILAFKCYAKAYTSGAYSFTVGYFSNS